MSIGVSPDPLRASLKLLVFREGDQTTIDNELEIGISLSGLSILIHPGKDGRASIPLLPTARYVQCQLLVCYNRNTRIGRIRPQNRRGNNGY
jgi:hypothetical protein